MLITLLVLNVIFFRSVHSSYTLSRTRFLLIMEEPVFIKCEPGYVSGTAELNNADCDVMLPTEEQTDVKAEPENVFYKPFIKEEIEIQDMKIETNDEEYNASVVSSKKNSVVLKHFELQPANFGNYTEGFQCSVCRRYFTPNCGINEHHLMHSGLKAHSCAECGKSFRHRSELRTHRLVHSGEKKYVCSVCGSRFKLEWHLSKHLLTHTNEKSHICSYCGKAFALQRYLNVHFSVHTLKPNKKRYICNTCGRAFSQSKSLKTHFCIEK
ncbi:zinc finger protein 22 isoform X3 [Anabrus simplex]|uniref:zinc finger protein 22 isoform X3 n=1 Tax=Anabrus simplex TaxID=316456 RepID=UPI0035A2C072